jgi:hypothetical protein
MPLSGCCDLCFDGEYFLTALGIGGQGDCFGLVSGFPGRIEFYFDGACCAAIGSRGNSGTVQPQEPTALEM